MDAGYALLVEAYMQSNVPMLEAIRKIDEEGRMRAGDTSPEEGTPPENVESMNDASLAELQKLMMGMR